VPEMNGKVLNWASALADYALSPPRARRRPCARRRHAPRPSTHDDLVIALEELALSREVLESVEARYTEAELEALHKQIDEARD
jgi:hypothetical protein